jgi:hypothetical protein
MTSNKSPQEILLNSRPKAKNENSPEIHPKIAKKMLGMKRMDTNLMILLLQAVRLQATPSNNQS